MKIEAAITISRIHGGIDDKRISIEIRDKASGIQFVDAEMSLEDFAACITGLGYCSLDAEVRGLQYVGKQAVTESRRIEYTGPKTHDRKKLADWLVLKAKEDGWLVNSYLNSQGSVVNEGEKTFLNYSVTKYVTRTPSDGDGKPNG